MGCVKFGICGIGRMGLHRARVFARDSSRYKLVALCDVEAARIRSATEELGCRGYLDLEEFLTDPEMELAIISTRSLDHARHAEMALKAGKTVLLEKPIGVTAADYQLLRQLVHSHPEKLFFCHNHRFDPAFVKSAEIAAGGVLGNVFLVKLCHHRPFMRRNDWQTRLDCGGGQLSVLGPHSIDHGLQLMGALVKSVHSYLRRILTPGDGDDHLKIIMTGENDRIVEVEISNSMAQPESFCTIYGDRGSLKYNDWDAKEIHLKYLDPAFQWPPIEANAGTPAPGAGMHADPELPWIVEIVPVQSEESLWSQVEVELAKHLYKALRKNIPFPITSNDALEVVRITEMVKAQNPQFKWIG